MDILDILRAKRASEIYSQVGGGSKETLNTIF